LGETNSSSTVPQWRQTDYTQHDVIAADHVFSDVNNATINDHVTGFAVTRRRVLWLAFRDQVRSRIVIYTNRYIRALSLISTRTEAGSYVHGVSAADALQRIVAYRLLLDQFRPSVRLSVRDVHYENGRDWPMVSMGIAVIGEYIGSHHRDTHGTHLQPPYALSSQTLC